MRDIISKIKDFILELRAEKVRNSLLPSYRVLDIVQDEDENYKVHVQIVNKSLGFHMTPEEILADDNLVDQFSQRDVRTLTYLGYLGINAPKYKILAKRLVDNNNLEFIIKKKGDKKIITKSAADILKEQEMISSMQPEDAKIIGYTVGVEEIKAEASVKQKLLEK